MIMPSHQVTVHEDRDAHFREDTEVITTTISNEEIIINFA